MEKLFEKMLNMEMTNREMYEQCRNLAHKPMTNEEWLRTLPADERVKEVLSHGFMTEKRTAEEFVEWLKEIHDAK